MKNLYLVDVSSMFFRAFFAIRRLSSPSGMPVNAIYGFTSMTVKLLREIKPDYIAFCYDRPEPSFRVDIDPNYKAHREEMPEDLVPQIPYIKKLADALGIPSFEKQKFEADDVIGTLTEFGRKHKLDVYIVSGDKDFAQLIKPHVTMFDPMKDIKYDSAAAFEKWGVRPDQMIDYLALVGDSSDNIPGVHGIGPKGAQKLLGDFESLDGIYKNIDKISGKLGEKLRAGKNDAYLSQRLVTIETQVPLDVNLEQLQLRPLDRKVLTEILTELDFKTFAKALLGEDSVKPAESSNTASPDSAQPVAANSEVRAGDVDATQERLDSVEAVSRWLKGAPDIWVLSADRQLILGKNINGGWALGEIALPKLEDYSIAFENFPGGLKGFDIKSVARRWHLPLRRVEWDHMLAAYVIRTGEVPEFNELVKKHCGRTPSEFPSGRELLNINLQLEDLLVQRIQQIQGMRILREIDFPLVPILTRMESYGVKLDLPLLEKQDRALTQDIGRLEKEIFAHSGKPFNIGSPKQLAQILFVDLKLPPGKKTKTGFSTDSDVLEDLKDQHPIIPFLLQYRELTKLKSTYVDSLPHQVDGSGRIHTIFHQAQTSTGRLSSTNPNLQNIPIRTERGNAIRQAFIADQGSQLISADYSQIELRLMAHITEDPGLLRAFESDEDIHAATASEVFGVALREVTPDMRRQAKAINFGLAYGQGVFGLAETLGIERSKASEIIDRYFTRFSRVKDYMVETVEVAKKKGFVETIFGRRRYIDELNSKNNAIKKFGERAAINTPLQGSASDIVKLAMISVGKCLDAQSHLLLQVHDELLVEVSNKDASAERLKIVAAMESAAKLKVPLKVNAGLGNNWDEAHA